jgi:hypothetical protein
VYGVSTSGRPEVRPITAADAQRVAAFLHEQLNPRVSTEQWSRLLLPPWGDDTAPNRGFQLVEDERIVGAYAAVYSRRMVGGSAHDVCNLAAFCVLEEHRAHSVRLVRALLAQRGYVFTDFSPSGNVVAMNERLGFWRLDTSARLVANLPAVERGTIRVTDAPHELGARLGGAEARAYRDHREAAAARHLLVDDGENWAYLVYRRERRKRLPLFAVPLHAGGDRQLLLAAWPQVGAHLLRCGFPLTLAERRVLGFAPPGPGRFVDNRPKMVRSKEVDATGIDYLYSELALVEW